MAMINRREYQMLGLRLSVIEHAPPAGQCPAPNAALDGTGIPPDFPRTLALLTLPCQLAFVERPVAPEEMRNVWWIQKSLGLEPRFSDTLDSITAPVRVIAATFCWEEWVDTEREK